MNKTSIGEYRLDRTRMIDDLNEMMKLVDIGLSLGTFLMMKEGFWEIDDFWI